MDRGGRVSQSLIARLDQAAADALLFAHRKLLQWARRRANRQIELHDAPLDRRPRLGVILRKIRVGLFNLRPIRGTGVIASLILFAAAGAYGAKVGDRTAEVRLIIGGVGDLVANSIGFQLGAVQLSGERQVSREEIFALAGITENTSVLFFNAGEARAKLKALPWIKEATVQKLYPDRLQINIVEREAFALWQRNGRIAVIDAEGMVIADYLDPRFQNLPLVVGEGAQLKARDLVTALKAVPAVAAQTRAAVLVAERRWNLRLRNGTDVRLPEEEAASALKRLAAMDAQQKILSRDVTSIDMRIADKVTLRLSDDAFGLRDALLKERAGSRKKKANDA